MKAAKFDYLQPRALDEALRALQPSAAAAGIKAMGGSQSFGPMLNLRLTRPRQVVDISHLAPLRELRVDGQTLRIGAAVTHAQIEDGVHEVLRGSMLQYVAGGIAYRAVRNRGTVGGSLAHADPAADWVLALTALAATLELQSATGTRKLGMDDFMLGAYTTALQEGEIITAVQVPLLDGRARWGYQKFCRKTGEFAEASCAAVFDPTRQRARVVLGALDGAPRALPELARQIAATGQLPEPAQIDQALIPLGSDPVRLSMQRAVVTRCLRQVLGLPGGASSQEKQP
jgi:carbon-monoxide dehydrogenase medium subunit